MYQKQNVLLFDGVVIMLIASLLFGAWSFTRSLQLVRPSLSNASPAIAQPAKATLVAAEFLPDSAKLTAEFTNDYKKDMKAILAKFAAGQPNELGLFVKHIDSGAVVGSRADIAFVSASLYKPFAAVEALKLVDKDLLSLNAVLPDTGGRTVRQCVIDTISVSDNPCGLALLSTTQLTVAKLQADGYSGTDLSGLYPVTTAADVAKLFEHIYRGDLLSRSSNKLLLDALKNQQVNNRLPIGLPAKTVVAHKTGDLEGYAHDAGIVYGKHGDYIIVALSGPDNTGRDLAQRYTAIGQLASQVNKSITALAVEMNGAGLSFD